MITALNGDVDDCYENHKVFGIAKPQSCPNVPSEILNQETPGKTHYTILKQQS
jgi:hypothetical protein